MKKIFLSVLIFVIIIIIVVLNGFKDKSKVTIGWFGPLSGPVASLGEQNLKGAQLALKDFSRGNIKLLIEDDQFTAKNSISAYEKLKNENVSIMLSPTYNAILALASRADKDKIFVVNSIDASSEIANAGEYVLGIGYYADGHGKNFARTIEQSHAKNVAVFYNQGETFTRLIVDAFVKEYKGTIGLVEGFKPSSNDFRTSISKMKSLNIDTVLLIGWDETGYFIKQSQELGFAPSVYGLASFTSTGFLNNAGKINIPTYYLGWDQESKQYNEIVKKYREEFGDDPSQPLFVALGYDAMTYIIKTLEKSTDINDFKNNLYKMSVEGLTGNLTLDQDGIVRGITSQSKLFRVQ